MNAVTSEKAMLAYLRGIYFLIPLTAEKGKIFGHAQRRQL